MAFFDDDSDKIYGLKLLRSYCSDSFSSICPRIRPRVECFNYFWTIDSIFDHFLIIDGPTKMPLALITQYGQMIQVDD